MSFFVFFLFFFCAHLNLLAPILQPLSLIILWRSANTTVDISILYRLFVWLKSLLLLCSFCIWKLHSVLGDPYMFGLLDVETVSDTPLFITLQCLFVLFLKSFDSEGSHVFISFFIHSWSFLFTVASGSASFSNILFYNFVLFIYLFIHLETYLESARNIWVDVCTLVCMTVFYWRKLALYNKD